MTTTSVITVDRFSTEASALRAHFDERFAEPRSTARGRFVWDWWHVPSQYTLLRTPAWEYFPTKIYRTFHERLVWWGRRTLGCHDVSPPWLSLYVDGCRQEFHADRPHGPFAFVFSLTRWAQRNFRGGETLLMKEPTLSYWSRRPSRKDTEEKALFRALPPVFNRLTLFDPRLPHAVRRVEGPLDPRQGRLVIHGWFAQPRPFVEGPLPTSALAERLGDLTLSLRPLLAGMTSVEGIVSVRARVGLHGRCDQVRVLANTLRSQDRESSAPRRVEAAIGRGMGAWRFSRQRKPSWLTVPFVFER